MIKDTRTIMVVLESKLAQTILKSMNLNPKVKTLTFIYLYHPSSPRESTAKFQSFSNFFNDQGLLLIAVFFQY